MTTTQEYSQSLINILTRASRISITSDNLIVLLFVSEIDPTSILHSVIFFILPPSPIFRLLFFSSESLPVCLPRRRRHHSSSSVSVAMQMACRSFNSPIALNKFYISTRMIDPRWFLLVTPVCSSLIWQTILDRYPRIVSDSLGKLCNLRFWLMLPSRWSNDRSIGSGLPSLPVSDCPVSCLPYVATFDSSRCFTMTIALGIFDGFWVLNWWTTDEGPIRCHLDTSVCIQLAAYFRNDLVDISQKIISKNPFVTRVSKSVSSMQTC